MKKLLMMADGFVFAGTERSCSNEQKVPFDEGYEFFKNSDLQYNLYCSPVFEEAYNWKKYYNLSDEEDEEERKYWLNELYQTIGSVYKN
ncbi:hypothetical protein [Treponema saccharophilum]|uniref:Uncharacterized protein n=1 Tax=Treponema saccharophilum DSM 2985 TaxID=907348 RepID=H7EJI6_9SPIR|nr:hypothetical protein [Treponema saccharophilum]EIC02224.1 hypothetical protein TresaDRAFT_1488 [Treponema saccharophilum DSM 2985]BDC97308.1 hypothetical protein TRSA_24070 [Treponema saccharophilum]